MKHLHALRRACMALSAVGALVSGVAQAATYYEEQGQLVRASRAVGALGPNLFGDQVNHYNGSLSFTQTDVSLPGTGALPMAVGRRLAAGSVLNKVNGHFGRWDLEIPRIQGLYAQGGGFTTALKGTDRCSNFSEPPTVAGTTSVGSWTAKEYWRGHMLYVPGVGEQEILKRAAGYARQPEDGQAYPLLTKQFWMIRCIPMASGAGSGEGFLAVSPDGVQYRFDRMVVRPADLLERPTATGELRTPLSSAPGTGLAVTDPSIGREALATPGYLLNRNEIWLVPSEIRDRNGNTVRFTYDPADAGRLLTMEASDGRKLTFSYVSGTRRISSVTDGRRTWTYGYDAAGDLSSVTLPDGSRWGFSGNQQFLNTEGVYSGSPSCTSNGYISGRAITTRMTHPSGAVGEFTVTDTEHARAYVPQQCFGPGLVYSNSPPYYGVPSLTRKVLSGPGLPSGLVWQYSYSSAAGQGSDLSCSGGCPDTKWTEVKDPLGQRTRFVHGMRVGGNDGQLLQTLVYGSDGSLLRSSSQAYAPYDLGPYPAELGTSLLRWGDGRLSARITPLKQRSISQQGQSFNWAVSAFDEFARVVSQTRSGPSGFLNETLNYLDAKPVWALGQLAMQRNNQAAEAAIENDYDTKGRLTGSKKYGVPQFTQGYNDDGTLAWRRDGRGKQTTYSNYKLGLPQTVSYADGSSESAVVDNLGFISSHTNAAGYTTSYGYDAAGRLSLITPPSGWTATTLKFEPVSSAEYGLPAGHWRQTVSTGNARTTTYYDAFWRPVMTRSFDAAQEASTRKVVVKGYDGAGQLAFESYPQRDATSVSITSPGKRMRYDALGRLLRTEMDSELGVLASTQAYLNGFQTQLTNARGKTSTQSFWALDKPEDAQLASATMPEGVSLSITRDGLGKPTAISRGGVTRRYVYDKGQRLCKTVEPEIGATIQAYDAAGNLDWKAPGQNFTNTNPGNCDTANVPDAAKIRYTYDDVNQLASTIFGDNSPAITRTYWPDGKLKTVDSNGSRWSYGYNSLRLLNTETLSYAGQSFAFSWDYNPNGHLSSLSYPATGTALSYLPNALGEPSQVELSTPAGKLTLASGVNFHPNGAVAGYRLGNGIQHTLTQNLRGLPETNEDLGVLKDAYAYDANGNVTGITDKQESVFSRSMAYDDLDRLRSANAPGVWGTAGYTYDAADNLRTANVGSRSVTLNYTDGSNRLNSLTVNGSTSAYTYDPYGNIRSKGAQTYTFDLGNRLSASSLGGSYVYDGLGRRVLAQLKDGSTRMTAYSQSGQLLGSVMAGGSLPSPVKTIYVYLAGKEIAETNDKNELWYTHTDALGSPVARTNAGGVVMSRTRYEPYGYVAQGTKPGPNTSLMGFTGHVQDPETELVYMQQRYYDPIAGRFLSVDPVVTDANTGAGFGLYTYVNNSPYGSIDPDGRLSNDDCRKVANCEVLAGSDGGSSEWRTRAKIDGNYVSTVLEQSFDSLISDEAMVLFPPLVLGRMALGNFRSLGNYMAQPSIGGTAVLAMGIIGKIGPAAKGVANFSRELKAADMGLQGTVKELRGTFALKDGVATMRVDMIRGDLANPLQVVGNMAEAAKASGATSLRIEGTIANERLYNVLERRYGLTSSGATDVITIPLK